ncbi:MBL fold metallo-hydrolase [Heyndrickxia vini]|uniref:MBL fold metallo-hydrolase n=1 Tax=Heyndrickxia vini TaxID=1476025 RepID=UPI001FED0297|nr:MBL fold metallo-hydrolase [Heyndrickxia vini]
MNTIDIDGRIKLIDLNDLNQPKRTGSYVLLEDSITLIETSASPSIPYLKEGLAKLNIGLDQIKYIILTHIHLDHGGGAGLFLKDCPNAQIVVHPKAARHLIDPTRLELGARAVYNEQFDQLFHPIIPIPKSRIITKENEETLQIGSKTSLIFYDTPGHANHHFGIYDPVSNGMFTGDTAGIYYWTLKEHGFDLFLPTTSPNQFNPLAMIESIKFFEQKNLSVLYFGHFGFTKKVALALDTVKNWIHKFVECSKKGYLSSELDERRIENTYLALRAAIFDFLYSEQVPKDHPVFATLELDLKICSMGLIDYLDKKE